MKIGLLFFNSFLAIYSIFYNNIKALLNWTIGVAVNMSPCHGEDHGFDSRMTRQHFFKEAGHTIANVINPQMWLGSSVSRASD